MKTQSGRISAVTRAGSRTVPALDATSTRSPLARPRRAAGSGLIQRSLVGVCSDEPDVVGGRGVGVGRLAASTMRNAPGGGAPAPVHRQRVVAGLGEPLGGQFDFAGPREEPVSLGQGRAVERRVRRGEDAVLLEVLERVVDGSSSACASTHCSMV